MATVECFTVILADRNRSVRELLSREFVRDGFSVKSCGLGREAASLAASGGDLLVVDVDLPDMDTLSIIRQARLTRPRLPVAVHAHAADEAESCLGEALVFFVPKRDDPAMLVQAVRGVLEKSMTGLSGNGSPDV